MSARLRLPPPKRSVQSAERSFKRLYPVRALPLFCAAIL